MHPVCLPLSCEKVSVCAGVCLVLHIPLLRKNNSGVWSTRHTSSQTNTFAHDTAPTTAASTATTALVISAAAIELQPPEPQAGNMAELSEFTYDPKTFSVTPAMKEAFKTNGYVIIRQVLNPEEMRKVNQMLESPEVQRHAYTTADEQMRQTRMVLWFKVGEDVAGCVASMNKIAGTIEQLMDGDEVYHFSTKILMKEANQSGSFLWHQDYGYFYNWGYMYPDCASIFLAVDDCTKANGCLEVLRGSHRMGRIHHEPAGKQLQADLERVEEAKKLHEHLYMEMKAGDILYFTGNLLHRSLPNTTNKRRWSYVIAYNQKHNRTYMGPEHPRYTPHAGFVPLKKVSDSALLECQKFSMDDQWFLKEDEDKARE
ncbi:uncharacterized protein LOC135105074 isoform X2 [Scylla paramamosain]|uniref:uncharacterized protein LOC135105074 isoform X2 n=1 Tax=Scylla paramamosain TaxID=85552 RepID=UPI0030833BEA